MNSQGPTSLDKEPYDSLKYWEAYGAIDWMSRQNNEEFQNAARSIADALPPPGDLKRPIDILDLGLGVGIMELPLLAQLERLTGRKVRVVGLDKYRRPMEVTRRFLAAGLEQLPPTTEEFLARLRGYWNSPPLPWIQHPQNGLLYAHQSFAPHLPTENHTFIEVDLDFRRSSTLGNAAVFSAFPSDWARQLKDGWCSKIPARFDMVIASFCLLHLTWWRWTLLHAIGLLSDGGLFLHSRLGGDEEYFEGRFPAEPTDDARVAYHIFSRVFGDPEVKRKYLLRPRYMSASLPTELHRFLDRLNHSSLPDERTGTGPIWLERRKDINCFSIENSVCKNTYEDLLTIAGYSTFRHIRDFTGSRYKALISNALDGCPEGYDKLKAQADWEVWKSRGPAKRTSWLGALFGVTADVDPHSEWYQISDRLRREYSITTAMTAALPPDSLANYDNLPNDFARALVSSGILSRDTIAGEIISAGGDRPRFHFVLNPLWRADRHAYPQAHESRAKVTRKAYHFHAAAGCLTYLFLLPKLTREVMGDPTYSNTGILLRTIMPSAMVPCVFTFRKMRPQPAEHRYDLQVEAFAARGFREVRFSINGASPWPSIRRLTKPFRQAVLEWLRDTKTPLGSRWRSRPFSFELHEESDLWKKKLEPIWRQQPVEDLEDIRAEVETAARKFRDQIANQVRYVSPEFADGLRQAMTRDSLSLSLMLLNHVGHWGSWAIYPAVFSGEGGAPMAEEAVLALYDKPQKEDDLEHEFAKSSIMFAQLGMGKARAQARAQGRDELTSDWGHEVKNVASAIGGQWLVPLKALFELRTVDNLERDTLWLGSDSCFHDAKVAPFPGLIDAARRVAILWCGTARIEEVFGANVPRTLSRASEEMWTIAVDALIIHACRMLNLADPFYISQARARYDAIKAAYRLTKSIAAECDDAVFFDVEDNRGGKNSIHLLQLLLNLFVNCVRHGEPLEPFRLAIKPSEDPDKLVLQISNREWDESVKAMFNERHGAEGIEDLRTLLSYARNGMNKTPLAPMFDDPGRGKGASVLERILRANDGIELNPPKSKDGWLERTFVIPRWRRGND